MPSGLVPPLHIDGLGVVLSVVEIGIERLALPGRFEVFPQLPGLEDGLHFGGEGRVFPPRKPACVSAASRKFRNFSPTR